MATYRYSSFEKFLFYFSYIFLKLFAVKDVSVGKTQIAVVELLWTLRPFIKKAADSKKFIWRDYFVTRMGSFYAHKDLQSIISLSPAFERQDIDYLFSLIGKDIRLKKNILFLDVGSGFGEYSIGLSNKFRRYKKLSIIAFEPNANNFSSQSYSLLKKNITLNKRDNIKALNVGLGATDAKRENKFGIIVKKLDSIFPLKYVKKFDAVYVKMDIEGFETEAMKGAKIFFSYPEKVVIMVEDAVDKRIITYMEKDYNFLKKLTPFNSFWIKEYEK